jgi:hypothetical protein
MLHLVASAAIYLAGNYEPSPPTPNNEAAQYCGPGTLLLNNQCVAQPQVGAVPQQTIIVQQPNVLVPTGYGYGFGGSFPFRHWR